LRHARIPLPQGHVWKRILPLTLVAALTLAACGGGSSDKTTATSASTNSSANAAATTASTTAPITTATAVTTPDATSEATSASTPAATSAAAGGDDAASEFEKMVADAWANAKSYKTTLNIYDVDATTPSMTSTTETMAPDKEHTVTSFAGQTMESIRIGDDTYVKLGDTWQKSPNLDASAEPPVSGDDVVGDLSDPSTPDTKIVKKGEETLDGVKVTVYEVTMDDGTLATFWVGTDDHLPRKTEIKSDTGHFEVIFSDYGKDFGIKAPI
jgi:hypothetical protein